MARQEHQRPVDSALPGGSSGPFLARVLSHLDNRFMGSLKVQILRVNSAGTYDLTDRTMTAYYASPFYGSTSHRSVGNTDDYQNTQQTYGMWFVPPDPDTTVLVTMVEGRSDICFWFACVPDDYMNFMIPDGRPSTTLSSSGSGGQNGRRLPVGEYNKRIVNPQGNNQPTSYPKPVNTDFVNTLTEEGLLEDDHRGLTSSSARRELPSAVYGVNTPGPLDKRPSAPRAPRGPSDDQANIPRSRLGGHSLVMDDGDDKLLRRFAASEGGPEYIDIENGDGEIPVGAETRPANELFRIRTRTGHQILLHNTEDLIYISNARGTAWVELTSNGKIDVYAQDSISMHTEGEFNLTADSNINLTSGGNINLNSTSSIKSSARNIDTTAGGRIAFKAASEFTALAGDYMALKSSADLGLTSGASNVNISAGSNVELNSGSDVNIISDGGKVAVSASTSFDASAGTQIVMGAPEIHDSSDSRFIDATEINLFASAGIFVTGNGTIDLLTPTLKIEGSGTVDIRTDGALTASSGAATTFQAGALFEVGSTNFSTSSSALSFNGVGNFSSPINVPIVNAGIMNTSRLNAGISRANHVSGSGSGPSSVSYSANAPGDAAIALPSAEGNIPAPPAKTDPPEPTEPNPADIAARVPEHEPWFQHENLDPAASNVRAGNGNGIDSYNSPLQDTFLNIGRNVGQGTVATQQVGIAGPNAGVGNDDGDEGVDINYNYNDYNDNVAEVIGFFENNGFEPWVGAGVAGALQWEAGRGINPGAYLAPNDRSGGSYNIPGNGGLGARGICQWRDSGRRLTLLERYLGKSILIQPETNPNSEGYERNRNGRLPNVTYSSLEYDRGVRVAPANATLQEQLGGMLWEMNNTEASTLQAIRAVNSGSELQRARRVAEIMNDVFLRSQNPSIPVVGNTRVPVKTLRANSAQEIWEAYISGRSTAPINDPSQYPSPPPAEGQDPAANSRPRNQADPIDMSVSSNAPNVVTGSANTRQGPLRPAFISALNRAAAETGIHRITGTSFGNEPLRRINTSTQLPISNWRTFPSRAVGPGADMSGSGNSWRKLNPASGQFEFRSNGASWRTGTERHDTGLCIDAYLQISVNGNYRSLLPTNEADRNRIINFIEAFAKYGGRGVGVGGGNSTMGNGLFHLDMLGGDNGSGWNRQPAAWPYGGQAYPKWAVDALIEGIRNG